MKTLKFSPELVPLILDKSKTSTWRLFHDKNLKRDDVLTFFDSFTGKEFAKARVLSIKTLRFKELSEDDLEGHEKFTSKEEMYKTYSSYYKTRIGEDTELKIIRFELI
jgi:hypothetical protein